MGDKDLRLEKIVSKLVFYNISFSWLLPLDCFQLFFCCVTVKRSIKFPTMFLSLIFRRKRKPKIFGFENAMEGGVRKILTFVKL